MKEQSLELVDILLTDYQNLRKQFFKKIFVLFSIEVEVYKERIADFQNKFAINVGYMIPNIKTIYKQSLIRNESYSCDFNILKLFNIGETQHSYLLAFLLNPIAEHGQKNLFLNAFLDVLEIIRFSDNEKWIVTAEKGRIDVLLKRENPHSVIVVENKSNYAVDQSHQLYRYWYQEIYKPVFERNEGNITTPKEFYQIIYLSPEYWKVPSANSLCKPIEWDNNLPDKIPTEMVIKHLIFTDFVNTWLQRSLQKMPKDNHRMREYIKQYIEYWN